MSRIEQRMPDRLWRITWRRPDWRSRRRLGCFPLSQVAQGVSRRTATPPGFCYRASKMIVLRKLIASDAVAFQRAYDEAAATQPRFAPGFDPESGFAAYLARLREDELGLDLPENHVPSTMYFGFLDDALVGRLML